MTHSICKVFASCLVALLWLQPSGVSATETQSPANWGEFDDLAVDVAERVSFLAAEITEGQCRAVHELDARASLGVGSSFNIAPPKL